MDLCDLHEDCDGGDDEYNDICGEDIFRLNLTYINKFSDHKFCNVKASLSRTLWKSLGNGSKLHLEYCMLW